MAHPLYRVGKLMKSGMTSSNMVAAASLYPLFQQVSIGLNLYFYY
jgi:hypothetical protein